MKITKLVKQDKRDRVSVFVDGKYSFSVSTWQVASLGIRLEQELDAKQLEDLKNATEYGKLYDRTLAFLALRPRSQYEVETYLKKKTTNPVVMEQIMQQLIDRGYINDEKFADAWVENRRLHKLVSKRVLVQELRLKRISDDIITNVMSADATEEVEVARGLIAKKRASYPDELKLKAYLARKGFNYDVINQALSEED